MKFLVIGRRDFLFLTVRQRLEDFSVSVDVLYISLISIHSGGRTLIDCFWVLNKAGDRRESSKRIFIARRTTGARAASTSRWTDARVLAPSRLNLGGEPVVFYRVHASPAPSLQKNFREDENLFFRSVTGLANLGIGSGTLH